MGREAVQPSTSVARFLREKRLQAGLTLRDVSERLSVGGDAVPISTLARIEQGKAEPGVRRLHRLLRLYDVPPEQVGGMVHLEEAAGEVPPADDLERLYLDGLEHWRRGDISRGLAYLFAVRERVPENEASRLLRQKAIAFFAVAAMNLGKFKLAKQQLEEVLCEPPDPSILLNVLLALANVWRYLEGYEVALALLRQAEEHLPADDPQKRAWLLHPKALVLLDTRRTAEATAVLEQAIACYRDAGDAHGEAKALLGRAKIAESEGDPERALARAREAARFADERGLEHVALMARLELGRLLVRYQEHEEAVAVLQQALARAVVLGDRHLQFDAHHHLWKAHEQTGDRHRARIELEAAVYLLPHSDEASPEANEVRKRIGKEGGIHAPSRQTRRPSGS